MALFYFDQKELSMIPMTVRPYKSNEDDWRIRGFLRSIYELNEKHLLSWHVSRYDCWRWSNMENYGSSGAMQKLCFIWELRNRQIAGVLHPEDAGQVFLQVHPEFRNLDLEEAMLSQAEQYLAVKKENQKEITVWVPEHDHLRQNLLQERGYTKAEFHDFQWFLCLDSDIPEATVPAGYQLHALGDKSAWQALKLAHWASFHPDETQAPTPDEDWYHSLQLAPLYRRDLDLIVTTHRGDLVAFATVWFDDATRSGMFEPVGTVPKHQRKGLATALMLEGLQRLKERGAVRAHVGTLSKVANQLYNSVGFTNCDLSERWVKTF